MVMLESFPKPIIAEIYAAFAKIAPVRILLKVTNPKLLPPGLSDNVRTLPWVPQVQVLSELNNVYKNIKERKIYRSKDRSQ